jgi:hypothetical protein
VVGVPAASNAPGGRSHPAAAFNLYRVVSHGTRFTCSMQEFGYTEANKPISLIGERVLMD